MSSRAQYDSVIDDDDELCPLCIEEFDLSDKNFKPCPCGYQICQFCYNNIKTHSEQGRCPNCRRVYDDSTIQYRVPDVDEFKADLALKHRKAAAAKKKEAEKREVESSSRKNLAGVRVVQKNLVYVIGLNPTIKDEGLLLQTLRGDQYFGQYGDIEKIVVSKAKPGGNPHQGIGVYVTFARKVDAATCIAAVDGSVNGDRVLRAQYGTTKYCSAFLRNEQCNNRNCTFLHETGDDNESFSRQDLSYNNTMGSQRPHAGSQPGSVGHPSPHIRSIPPHVQPVRQSSSSQTSADGSALPSSASWANKDSHVQRARRASMTAHRSTPSPRPGNATVANKPEETKNTPANDKVPVQTQPTPSHPTPPPGLGPVPPRQSSIPPPQAEGIKLLDDLVKSVMNPNFRFIFSAKGWPDELNPPEDYPSLIDPYGGVKRRYMREKAESERAKQEAENRALLQQQQQSTQVEDENREGGSSQLGGEPDDPHPSSAQGSARGPMSVIQPPSQQQTAANSVVESPMSTVEQFQNLNLNGRTITPLQQQQLMLLKGVNGQQANLMDQLPATIGAGGFDPNPLARAAAFPTQALPMSGMQGHTRQSSRFSFANESKATTNQRIIGNPNMMQTSSPNPLATPTAQHGLGTHYFTSGVQGPPPGLKTAGTPPVSGGGMFAQGHGFTSAMNTNLGLGAKQDGNTDLMRELMRGRGATTGAGIQGHEAPKLDLADPSILQARMHQGGANAAVAGQGLYGSQGQAADDDFPPLAPPPKVDKLDSRLPPRFNLSYESPSGRRAGTPSLPPGLPLPHAHPLATESRTASPMLADSGRSTPALPPGLENAIKMSLSEVPEPKSVIARPSRGSGVSEISLGSPKPKSNLNLHQRSISGKSLMSAGAHEKEDETEKEKATGKEKAAETPRTATATPVKVVKTREPKQKPIKLDISLADRSRDISPSKVTTTPSYSAAAIGAPLSAVSRPNTPGAAFAKASESLPRQPRVLRVVDTPKPQTPPPAAVLPSGTSTPITKAKSRKPSLSSVSRPETPGEFGSEYTSASVSRANSPPPSRIGSAPVRSTTKNQLKKERKLKAKQAEEKEKELAAATVTEEPVQAPIIGRKRKTKKPKLSTDPSPTSVSEADKPPAKKEEVVKEEKIQAIPQKKEPLEPWRANNTLEQLIADAEIFGATIKDMFIERTKPLPTVLAELHQSGELDLNTHPLFNPPPAQQRLDMKCTAMDYYNIKKPIELTAEHKKQLLRGEPVRINPDSNLLKNRCIITPSGCVLRHLSAEEEDRYLALEDDLSAIDSLLEYPPLCIAEPDLTNRDGGLDALFATPEKFNIRWVDEAPQSSLLTGPSEAVGDNSWAMTMDSTPARSAASKLYSAGPGFGGELEELLSMPDDELRMMIQTAQRELEVSRKEADVVDKKVTALVKRNKKIVQQALAVAMELVSPDGGN